MRIGPRDIAETRGQAPNFPIIGDAEAKETYPGGWTEPRPYIRIVPQPA